MKPASNGPVERRRSLQVNCLPLEVLQHIFLLLAYCSDQAPFVKDSLYGPQSPFTLSKVCTRWRRASLSWSPIWAHIGITNSAYRKRHWKELMILQLERAGDNVHVPLHISVHKTSMNNDIIPLLRGYVSRCISLSLGHAPDEGFPDYFKDLPKLEVLHVSDSDQVIDALPDIVFSSQKLCELKGSLSSPYSLQVNWTHITTYALSGTICPEDHFDALLQMPNLISCSMVFHNCGRLSQSITSPVRLTKLAYLQLKDVTPNSDAETLVKNLDLPSLMELKVDGYVPIHALSALLRRSRCSPCTIRLHMRNSGYRSGYYSEIGTKYPTPSQLRVIVPPSVQNIFLIPPYGMDEIAFIRLAVQEFAHCKVKLPSDWSPHVSGRHRASWWLNQVLEPSERGATTQKKHGRGQTRRPWR